MEQNSFNDDTTASGNGGLRAISTANGMSYKDAVIPKMEIQKRAATTTGHLSELAAMGLSRHERRRLAKINGISKIIGSTKPFNKDSK